jgi:methylmalonyl-CoA mutase N-terminal domain/subunit
VKERYHLDHIESQKIHISAYTAGVALTARQPLNNIVRVALRALAAVMGAFNKLATSFDGEALSLPSEESVTVTLHAPANHRT